MACTLEKWREVGSAYPEWGERACAKARPVGAGRASVARGGRARVGAGRGRTLRAQGGGGCHHFWLDPR